MEVLLDIVFEKLEALERNCLHARYNRRALVDYFNTLIEGCRLGEECDPQKVVREAVVCILRYHENAKTKNGNVCMMGKYHNVLYIALKICYDWQLKDSATVATLLDDIFTCEKTFERLMMGAIFGTRAPHFIAGWKSDFDNQEENLRAVVYYLDHAANSNLEYFYENKTIRFADIPLESCGKSTVLKILVQLGVPDKLHIFLRFGALVLPEFDDQSESVVQILLDKLSENKGKYPYNIVACLQLILRVVPSLPVKRPQDCEEGSNFQRDYILDNYDYLVDHCIVPMNRCGLIPPDLKHLSRCVVRENLWRNHQLPQGVKFLPVPQGLRRYVDIMED